MKRSRAVTILSVMTLCFWALLSGSSALQAQNAGVLAEAKDLGLQTQMYMAPGQGHGFFNRTPWQERTAFLMDEFLVAQGYLKGKPTLDLPPSGLAMMKYEPAQ